MLMPLIERQFEVADGNVVVLVCQNLTNILCATSEEVLARRLAFNLSYLADDALIVDTCPYKSCLFFDNNYAFNQYNRK
jgi:hypothetical protein